MKFTASDENCQKDERCLASKSKIDFEQCNMIKYMVPRYCR